MKKKTLLISTFLISTVLCFAQMQLPFTGYENNPVLEADDPGDWDDGGVFLPFLMEHDGTIYLFYHGSTDLGIEPGYLGYATSTDGYNFIKSPDNPIFGPDGTGFDAWSTGESILLYENSTWVLYYDGDASSSGYGPGTGIGRATAPDLFGPWERMDEPILETGNPGEWDFYFISPMTVLKNDTGTYVMYYSSSIAWFPDGPFQIGMATSTDGINWTKYDNPETTSPPYHISDPVLEVGNTGSWDDVAAWLGCVQKIASGYEMLYSGTNSFNEHGIGYAVSADGISWIKNPGPIYSWTDDPYALNNGYIVVEGPKVQIIDSFYFMYYDYGPQVGKISLATAPALSQTIHVPGDQPTIQAGIDIATNGDTVLVAEGTYYENINFKGKAIIVASEYLIDPDSNFILNTIIDGSQFTNPDSASTVTFCSGEDTTSILLGFTITGGAGTYLDDWNDYDGGGIFLSYAGAKIINNRIINNIIDDPLGAVGGGIATNLQAEQYWVIIENNYIADNQCLADDNYALAGGVYVGINGRLINNIIENNYCNCEIDQASGGGFIGSGQTAYTHTIEFINNTVLNNEIDGLNAWGAGIYIQYCNATIKNNTISSNLLNYSGMYGHGAGVYLDYPINYCHIINNTISDNYSNTALHGGGIFMYETGTKEILVDRNLVQNNQAWHGGGFYACVSYNVKLTNNVFSGNHANGNGGALMFHTSVKDDFPDIPGRSKSVKIPDINIKNYNQNPNIINNTFFNNTANNYGGALYSNYYWNPVIINSIFWENEAAVGPDIYNQHINDIPVYYSDIDTSLIYGNWAGENNIDVDPFFVDDSCHVDQASECIESGVISIVINDQTFVCPNHDFDNEFRPLNATADIGADEVLLTVIDESRLTRNDLLLQNSPNPFSGFTTISFELESDCYTDLSIYDLTGKKVRTLISENKQSGIHEIELDAEWLDMGIYFCVLKTNEGTHMTKMIKL